jgi:hypothetical protein
MGDEKRKPFSKRFEILGAIVTLPSPGGTTIEVTNKESRLLQLKQQVDELKSLLKSSAPRAMLESLKGDSSMRRATRTAGQLNWPANYCTNLEDKDLRLP